MIKTNSNIYKSIIMSKQEYIVRLLLILSEYWDEAENYASMVETDMLWDSFFDYILQILDKRLKETTNQKEKDILNKSISFLENLRNEEWKIREIEQQEADDLLNSLE